MTKDSFGRIINDSYATVSRVVVSGTGEGVTRNQSSYTWNDKNYHVSLSKIDLLTQS